MVAHMVSRPFVLDQGTCSRNRLLDQGLASVAPRQPGRGKNERGGPRYASALGAASPRGARFLEEASGESRRIVR